MVITVANLKGGTGKTTSAVQLALALGRDVLLVDADPQGSAMRWSQGSGFPVLTVSAPVRDLERRIPELARGRAHVIIDTPPEDTGIVRSAVAAADRVLIPLSPSPLEFDRLVPTLQVLAEVENYRPELERYILLTRTQARTKLTKEARGLLEELRMPVLVNTIPHRQEVMNAFGRSQGFPAYELAAWELVA